MQNGENYFKVELSLVNAGATRIDLVDGSEFSLVILSTPNDGTCATLFTPDQCLDEVNVVSAFILRSCFCLHLARVS